MATPWKRWFGSQPKDIDVVRQEVQALAGKAPTPVLWLFGKTGSGKTSVIRYLTGADDAIIGQGFRPQTTSTRRYDFPSSDEPLVSFLDTRGLGEAAYDPTSDMEHCSKHSQLVLVTVRVTDHALDKVLEPLRSLRANHPERRVILIPTCLHQAATSTSFTSDLDPFDKVRVQTTITSEELEKLPTAVRILIEEKLKQFAGLFDAVIPIDLTHPDDGFEDPNFGGDRLKHAIIELLPYAYRLSLIAIDAGAATAPNSRQQRAKWQILASSSLAATAGAIPIPWIDVPAVLGVQNHMAYKLAEIYNQEITPANWAILTSAIGSNIALRLFLQGTLKFIPFVGIAASAASSFAFTYALGMSWDWYFADVRKGRVPSADELQQVFAKQLELGRKLWGVQKR